MHVKLCRDGNGNTHSSDERHDPRGLPGLLEHRRQLGENSWPASASDALGSCTWCAERPPQECCKQQEENPHLFRESSGKSLKTYRSDRPWLIALSSKTLHCGNKPHQLLAAAQTSQGELYSNSAGSNDELAFTGRLSHKLAMQQMKDNLAETDAAMAMLQSRMASHKKEKLAKQ